MADEENIARIALEADELAERKQLLDWFAGQALAGLINRPPGATTYFDHGVAQEAYNIADAMLAEREKRNHPSYTAQQEALAAGPATKCQQWRRAQGYAYPRTCETCGLSGPCKFPSARP